MLRLSVRLWVGALLVALLPGASAQEAARRARVDYAVDASDPASGRVTVTMNVAGTGGEPLRLGIPAWRPGSYRLQEYDKWYVGLTAHGPDGAELPVARPDKLTFAVDCAGTDPVTIRYVLRPAAADLTAEHFHIDAVGCFPYLKGMPQAPCRVRFKMPEGWDVATGLDKESDAYEARDYDTFADSPIELGRFTRRRFEQDGTTYELAMHGPTDFDLDAFVEMHRRIVAEPARLFGDVPFRRYVFIYHFNNRFGGYGLEHLNSTIIQFHAPALARAPQAIAPLTAHEFFHAWNVKRIRPRVLGPFDYTGPVRTRALWWSEGVTDYYAWLILVRAGLINERQFLNTLGAEIAGLQNVPERLTQSVEEASWKVWDGRQPIDYYNKGLLLGMLLDLRIRRLTDGRRSLDDVMRFLDRWFVKGGGGPIGVGFEETDLLRAVNAVTGRDFADFFDAYVAGTQELPYALELEAAGLALTLEYSELPYSGLVVRGDRVRRVTGPAEEAGLRVDDRITAVDGTAVDEESARRIVGALEGGKRATLKIVRGEEPRDIVLDVRLRRQVAECRVDPAQNPPARAAALRASWLSGREP
jgi:predicted metalloprotease with PDZ domain